VKNVHELFDVIFNPDCPLGLQSQPLRGRSPIHRAIDLHNNRAAPVKGKPEGAPLLRSDPAAASCAPTGFARFDEKSKRANEQFGLKVTNIVSGMLSAV
jgi:hypothetical protein